MITTETAPPRTLARRLFVLPMPETAERQRATAEERQLTAKLHTAARTIAAYPQGHPATATLARAAWSDVMAACGEGGRVGISVMDGELLVNGRALAPGDRNAQGLLEMLFGRDIRGIVMEAGIDETGVAHVLDLLSRSVDELDAMGGVDAVVEQMDVLGLEVRTVRYDRRLVEGELEADARSTLAEMVAPLLRQSLSAMGYEDADAVLSIIEQPEQVLRIAGAGDDRASEAKRLMQAGRHLAAAILSLAEADEALAERLGEAVGGLSPRLTELISARLGLSSAMQAVEALPPSQVAEMIEKAASAGFLDSEELAHELEDMATAAMLAQREQETTGPAAEGELQVPWERLDVRDALAAEMTDGGADPISQAKMLVELLRQESDPQRYWDLAATAVNTAREMIAARRYDVADELLEVLRHQAGAARPMGALVADLAHRAVDEICTPEAAEMLLAELMGTRDAHEKSALRRLLERFGEPALLMAEQIMITGQPASALPEVAEMLMAMPEPGAEALAQRLLEDAPRASRMEIMQAAARNGGDRAVRLLLAVLAAGSVADRQEALRLLGWLRAEDAAVPAGDIGCQVGWLDRRVRLREEAARTLAAIGTDAACRELEALVYARAPLAPWRGERVRRAALEGLCRLHGYAARSALEHIATRGPRWARAIAQRQAAAPMLRRDESPAELTAEGAESGS